MPPVSARFLFGLTALSLICLALVYLQTPNAVTFDVSFSLFAAQNAMAGHGLLTLEPNLPFPPDLAQIQAQWLTTWPPAVSLAFSALLHAGLTPGTATRLLALLSIASGSFGWLAFFKKSGLPKTSLFLLAALVPWTSFPVFAMRSFYNDHLLWGLVPWTLLALLCLPSLGTPPTRESLLKIAVTGLLCGLPFVIKYSAAPLLPAAAGFLLVRNGFRLSKVAIRETLFFSVFLALPPLTVFLINRSFSGETSAVLHNGFRLSPIGFSQIAHLILPPLLDVSGWSKIFSHLPSRLSFLSPICGGALCVSLLISVARAPVRTELAHSLRLLALFSFSVAGFLLCLTLFLGYFYDWTSETRYYFPIYFGLFALALGLSAHPNLPRILRTALFLSAGIPAVASLISAATHPFREPRNSALPKSRLAASRQEAAACQFLHTLPAPDLILCESPLPMNEFLVPSVPWFYLENHAQLRSSRPLRVWALLGPSATDQLQKRLPDPARITRPAVPDSFPWKFTEIQFP